MSARREDYVVEVTELPDGLRRIAVRLASNDALICWQDWDVAALEHLAHLFVEGARMTDTQLSLLPRARRTDDQASHDAAHRAAKRAGQYDARIFDLLNHHRALTKNQLCSRLDLPGPREWGTVSSRLSQLRAAGKLEWAGKLEGDGNLYRIAAEVVDTQGRT